MEILGLLAVVLFFGGIAVLLWVVSLSQRLGMQETRLERLERQVFRPSGKADTAAGLANEAALPPTAASVALAAKTIVSEYVVVPRNSEAERPVEIVDFESSSPPPPPRPLQTTADARPLQVLSESRREAASSSDGLPETKRKVAEPVDTDFEELVAGQWMTWIGAVAIVIGFGFGIKYALDNGWLGPAARVALGLISGIGCFVGAHVALRKDYRAFGQGLAGTALGVLYMTCVAAHDWYQLVSFEVSYFGMILTTVAGFTLAYRSNSQVIAVLGLIGGLLTPAVIPISWERLTPVFSYFFLLDAGVMALSGLKRWRGLALLAGLGTLFAWICWMASEYDPSQLVAVTVWQLLFFTLFSVMSVAYSLIRKVEPEWEDYALLVLTPLVGYSALLNLYADWTPLFKTYLTLGFASYYALWAAVAWQIHREGRRLQICLGGIALALITIAVPIYFRDYWIPIVWIAESVLLIELGLVFRQAALAKAGWGLLTGTQLLVARLVMTGMIDPAHYPSLLSPRSPEPGWLTVINGRSLTLFCDLAALAGLAWDLRRRLARGETFPGFVVSTESWVTQLVRLLPLGLLGLILLETWGLSFAGNWLPGTMMAVAIAWISLFAIALTVWSLKVSRQTLEPVSWLLYAVLAGVVLVSSLGVSFDAAHWNGLHPGVLWGVHGHGASLLFAGLTVIAAAVLYRAEGLQSGQTVRGQINEPAGLLGGFAWLIGFALLTSETIAQGTVREWGTATSMLITLLWTSYAFTTLVVGIYRRSHVVRWLALCLFLLATVKVYFSDLWYLALAIRVFAFMGLGVALLTTSYLYRRYQDRIREIIRA